MKTTYHRGVLDKLSVLDHQGSQVVIEGFGRPMTFKLLLDEYVLEDQETHVQIWLHPMQDVTVRLSRVGTGAWDVIVWPY